MQWFRNFSTTCKILLLVTVMIVLLIIVSAVGYNTSHTITGEMNALYRDYAMPSIWMEEMKSISIQNRRIILSMLATSHEGDIESYASRIIDGRRRIDELFSLYDNTNQIDEEKALEAKIKASMIKVDKLQDEMIDARKKHIVDENLLERLRTGGDIALAEDENTALIDELVALLVKMADEVSKEADETARAGIVEISALSVGAIVIGMALGIIISRMITGPILSIEKSIKMFAEGDLTSTFPSIGKDELARMGRDLTDMTKTLEKAIRSVKDASEHIAETAEE
ncbi:MAG: methyl-accepting chemotaxis protein, partial [Synergistaceae bacterium]|nr:methyl-accepting chemotaxis protein [Synergistaceae bacterium]